MTPQTTPQCGHAKSTTATTLRRAGAAIGSSPTTRTHRNIRRRCRHQGGAVEHTTGTATTARGIVVKTCATAATATDDQVLHRHGEGHGHGAIEHHVIAQRNTGGQGKRGRGVYIGAHGQITSEPGGSIRANGQRTGQYIHATAEAIGTRQINQSGALLNQLAGARDGRIDRETAGTVGD